VITDLVAKYESRWDDEVATMTPRELIQYLMEQNGLNQRDLINEFGSASRVSEFLKGTRRLSLEQAKKLAARFRLNISALIDAGETRSSSGGQASSLTEGEWQISSEPLIEMLGSGKSITYRTFFEALSNLSRAQKNPLSTVLQARVNEEAFSQAYCNMFELLKHWLRHSNPYRRNVAFGSSVAESSTDYYTANRSLVVLISKSIQSYKGERSWLRSHQVSTYAELLNAVSQLAVEEVDERSNFWDRSINPLEGETAIDKFAVDLCDELSGSFRKKQS
jgi:transcriptional regulator with XRE-family HTH domain